MRGSRPLIPLEKRLWDKIDKRGNNECWNWLGGLANGYGYISIRGEKKRPYLHGASHRIIYQLTYGVIPKDLFICHKCDNKRCCNPNHLFAGTPKENTQDCIKKGRNAQRNRKGSKHPLAKLTEEQVRKIKQLLSEGIQQKKIAMQFGVVPEEISSIKTGRIWLHIE